MRKVVFIANPAIHFYKMYYGEDIKENECISLRPDQIPDLILPALANVCEDRTVLALKMFLDMTDPDTNHLKAHITYWDGISAIRRKYKLFGDGSFERYGEVEII